MFQYTDTRIKNGFSAFFFFFFFFFIYLFLFGGGGGKTHFLDERSQTFELLEKESFFSFFFTLDISFSDAKSIL